MDKEDRFRQSTWLEFLYRHLTLARKLLAEDGVLLVSINDDHWTLSELKMNAQLERAILPNTAKEPQAGAQALECTPQPAQHSWKRPLSFKRRRHGPHC